MQFMELYVKMVCVKIFLLCNITCNTCLSKAESVVDVELGKINVKGNKNTVPCQRYLTNLLFIALFEHNYTNKFRVK
jgi:hypothetical protein